MSHPPPDVEPRADEAVTAPGEADAPRPRRRRRRRRRSWAKRRHLGRITVGVAVLLLAVGLLVVVLTWDSGRVPPSTQAARAGTVAPSVVSTTGVPTAASTAPGVPVPANVRGQVTAVGDGQLTMQTRSGLTYTVVVTTATTFAKQRGFDDYPVGTGIAVEGMLDAGVLTATTISPAAPN